MLKLPFRVSIVLMSFFMLFLHNTDAQIAPGVQQSAAQSATITGTVTQSDGAPVAGADVRLSGPAQLTTKSDAHGTFDFVGVPYGTYRIVVSSANLGISSRDALAVKGDITVSIQYVVQSASGLKEIAHVSTQSAGAAINVTPASIASIRPSEYAFQGNATWKELLNQIPGVTVSGDLQGGSDIDDFLVGGPISPVVLSINGALPYETSVTLDGMPLQNVSTNATPGTGYDLSALPMSTFDTADVVRGPGANAPSIVDSIGGSFVLHSPGRVEKNAFEFSAGNDQYGGILTNATMALRFGRLSAVIAYGVNDSPGPLGNTSVTQAFSYNPVTVNGQIFNGCSPGGPSSCASAIFCPQRVISSCGFQDNLLYCCVPYSTSWSQHNGAIAVSYDITPTITAQVFYTGSSASVTNPFGEHPVNFIPGAGYTGSLTPGAYNEIYVNPFDLYQTSSLLEEKLTAYLGHGVLRLAAVQNNSWSPANTYISTQLPNGQYTVYGTGYYASAPDTAVNFNGTPAFLTFPTCIFTQNYNANNRDLLASYATQVGSSSHIGVSYVTSYYNAPYEYSYDAQGCLGSVSQLSANSVTTNEIRLNAGTEVSNKLSLDASWYFARGSYHVQNPNDPTGSTWSDAIFSYSAPRVGAVWQASRDITIRAAAGGGYALPPLGYLIGTNSSPFCSSGICGQSVVNLNLKPEESFGFDLGTDMRFHRDTVLSLDVYRTNLFGQFFTSTTAGTYSGPGCGGSSCILYTTQKNNLQQSRYEGVNFSIQHQVQRGIYWRGALGLMRAYVVSVPPGFYNNGSATCNFTTGAGCRNTYIVPGINFNGVSQAGISPTPYATSSVQLGYRWSPGRYLDLSPTYYGNGNPYFEPAFVEFDAHAGYSLTKTVSIFATLRNVTNIYGRGYDLVTPSSIAVPTVAGFPYTLYGIPYGPRALIVTANFSY